MKWNYVVRASAFVTGSDIVIILFGERVASARLDHGVRHCGVCNRETHFSRVVETNYFCLFGLRLIALEKIADYLECNECEHGFRDGADEPAVVAVIQRVVTWVFLGYGMRHHHAVADEICRKVCRFELSAGNFDGIVRQMSVDGLDIHNELREAAKSLNTKARYEVIEAAFLATYVCCEIQHEDRVRINLLGNALGVPLTFVASAIDSVRQQHYFGVRRLLPAQAT